MILPHLGATVTVRATVPNVEREPCSGRFFDMEKPRAVAVTPHIAARLRDGSLVLVPAPAAAPAGDA